MTVGASWISLPVSPASLNPGRAVYKPMKAAFEALTRYLAIEVGPRRIAGNVVAPDSIVT